MIIDGMASEILEKMDLDFEDELPWSEFIEFMDELYFEKKSLHVFLTTGRADYDELKLYED